MMTENFMQIRAIPTKKLLRIALQRLDVDGEHDTTTLQAMQHIHMAIQLLTFNHAPIESEPIVRGE